MEEWFSKHPDEVTSAMRATYYLVQSVDFAFRREAQWKAQRENETALHSSK
jgi:hypothetical protein